MTCGAKSWCVLLVVVVFGIVQPAINVEGGSCHCSCAWIKGWAGVDVVRKNTKSDMMPFLTKLNEDWELCFVVYTIIMCSGMLACWQQKHLYMYTLLSLASVKS